MFIRFVIGTLLAAVVLFFWGFLFWVVSPLPQKMLTALPAHEELNGALGQAIEQRGVYVFPPPQTEPSPVTEPSPDDTPGNATEGNRSATSMNRPFVLLVFDPAGVEPMSTMMTRGFLLSLAVAFSAAVIMAAALPETYMARVMLMLWVGVFAGIYKSLGNVIYWHYSWAHGGWDLLYTVVGALAMGIVLAALIRPGREQGYY